MKKSLFISILLLGGMVCQAQKDTMHYRDPWYLFNPLSSRTTYSAMNWAFTHDMVVDDYPYFDRADNSAQVYNFNKEVQLTVYGVAIVMDTVANNILCNPPYHRAMLFDSIGEDARSPIYHEIGLLVIDSADYSYTRRNYFEYQYNYENQIYNPGSRVFPCYEFYFDTPHSKYWDKIIVGQRCTHGYGDVYTWRVGPRFLVDSTVNSFIEGSFYNDTLATFIRYFIDDITIHMHSWGGFFPIIRLRCTLPRGLHETGRGNDNVSVAWQNHDEASGFQVAIYPVGTPVDSIVPVDVNDTSYTFTGLTPGVNYLYSVRKLCHYATNSYDTVVGSDWFPPQQLRLTQEGVADVGAPRFSVSPNPASGTVAVTLTEPAEGCRMELYNVEGRQVAALDMASTTATLDLQGHPSGVYLLKLFTPKGTAVRKLVVR